MEDVLGQCPGSIVAKHTCQADYQMLKQLEVSNYRLLDNTFQLQSAKSFSSHERGEECNT